jgi:catechol 2,3-dioxygenase-like lactoylglutathione lyase family enzyme
MSVSEMEHVLVLSDDVEATREFYCRVVGLRVGERPPLEFHGYWLYAGESPCLHIAERNGYLTHAASLGLAISRQPPGTGSVDHIAFTADDYDEIRRRLADDGVRAVPNQVPAAGLRQLFFEDPNGVRVEINVRTPA